jgi:hypothetical protein
VTITRAVLVALVAAAIAGCSDSNEPETTGIAGQFSFTYTGAGAANATSFTANGAMPVNAIIDNGTQPWSVGFIDASGSAPSTGILGLAPRSSTTWDIALVSIDRTTVGSSDIVSTCTAENCTSMGISFGSNQNETNYLYSCELTTGTVSLTAITSTTAAGTFSGTGSCFNLQAGGETPFTVTNGSFSVGLTSPIT